MGSNGYVLVGTLVLLALLTLVAGRFATRIDQLRTQTSGLNDFADGLVQAQSARARMFFRIATAYPGPGGLTEIDGGILRADGSPLLLEDGVVATLQDHRGLMSLNNPDPAALSRLLVAAGLPDGQAAHLVDTLADYADTDGLNRLNGAEAGTYLDKGLLPPRNDWLQSPEELRQIVGWVQHQDVVERFLPWVSARRDTLFNPYTAPREVMLARFPNLAPPLIEAVLQRRAIAQLATPAGWRDLVGTAFDNEETIFFIGDTLRLTLQAKGVPVVYTYNVMLTPGSQIRPWTILDSRTVAAAPPAASGVRPDTRPSPSPSLLGQIPLRPTP